MVSASAKFPWGMNVDGTILTEQPDALIRKGEFVTGVSITFGNCLNETGFFLCPTYPNGITNAQYHQAVVQLIQTWFPMVKNAEKVANEVVHRFPSSSYQDPLHALIDVENLLVWFCPIQGSMEIIAEKNLSPVFQYVLELIPGFSSSDCFGVGHSFDLPFFFPPIAQGYKPGYHFTAAETALSEFMIASWARFAIFGTPGAGWHPTDSPTNSWNYTILDSPVSVGRNFRYADCGWWWQVLADQD
jgi:carboxylesterase type B